MLFHFESMTRRRFLQIISISLFIGLTSMLWRQISSKTSKLAMTSTTSATGKNVIVVGSGLAGLSAASVLVEKGVKVRMLERFAKPGGNSMKASSGINGAQTRFQPEEKGPDTWFYEDTIKSVGKALEVGGKRKEREELVATLTNGSAGAVNWLVDEKGVDLSVVAQLGGHSFPRTHRGAGQTPPGASIVTTLLKSLKGNENFGLETECQVLKVLKGDGEVRGVEYVCKDDGVLKTALGAVVFATGGFAGDAHGYLAKYRPDLKGFPSTNDERAGTQRLLTDIGGTVLDMDQVQVHPTAFVDPKDPLNPQKFLAAELLRGEGGLLLHEGKRFINEMETRKNVTDKIMAFPTSTPGEKTKQWDVDLVMDEATYLVSKSHVDFYLWKGLMRKTTISDLGPEALESIKEFSAVAASNGVKKDELKRNSFGHWALKEVTGESVIYTGKVTPAVHFTMGGVLISKRAEVVDKHGEPIKGIWAAGEITGGVHGENRLGGSSLLECVVFGRLAGEGAAKYIGGK